MSVLEMYVWYLVSSAQIRSSGLLLGLPLLFLICMSFKSGISFLITFMLLRFLVPNLLLLVKISALLLLHVFCFPPSSSYDHQSKPISCPLSWMDATVLLLSTDRSSMFIINPEVQPRDIREFIIFIFPYTFDTPLHFLCRSQTVLKEPYFGGISIHPSIHPSTSTQKDIHTRSH